MSTTLYLCPHEGCTARLYDESGGTKIRCHVHGVVFEEAPDPAEVGLENMVVGDNTTFTEAGDPTSQTLTPEEQNALDDASREAMAEDEELRQSRLADLASAQVEVDVHPDEVAEDAVAAAADAQEATAEAEANGDEEEAAELSEPEVEAYVEEGEAEEDADAFEALREEYYTLSGQAADGRWGQARLQQEVDELKEA